MVRLDPFCVERQSVPKLHVFSMLSILLCYTPI
ncbi:hypothetical protein LINPERPRIM_LOCUS29971 [Linum perenne]